jgi:hypothetical protein
VLVLGLLLNGCGGDSDGGIDVSASDSSGTPETTASTDTPAEPGGSTDSSEAAVGADGCPFTADQLSAAMGIEMEATEFSYEEVDTFRCLFAEEGLGRPPEVIDLKVRVVGLGEDIDPLAELHADFEGSDPEAYDDLPEISADAFLETGQFEVDGGVVFISQIYLDLDGETSIVQVEGLITEVERDAYVDSVTEVLAG